MTTNLEQLIGELGLDEHRRHLLQIMRPSVELIAAEGKTARGGSKFGGSPDLPADFEWPEHGSGPYRFIGQINLGGIPAGHGLPPEGLLSFFYAHDEDGEIFWQDPDYVRAFYFDGAAVLKPVTPPKEVRLGSTAAVSAQPGADVPPWPWRGPEKERWPIAEELRDAYWKLRRKIHPSGYYLLGYPSNPTLGYDPTPGPGWRSLLTLQSDDDLEWCWHDGDTLVTFIEDARLRACDFSEIKSDAG